MADHVADDKAKLLARIRGVREYVDMVCHTAALLPPEDLNLLQEAMAAYDAIGPSIDPSIDPASYRNAMDTQRKKEKLFAAFSAFHRVVREVWDEERKAAMKGTP